MLNADGERPIHLLLVEDEPDLRSALRYNFKRSGFSVTTAVNGKEALLVLDEHQADHPIELVVSDVMMPEMDGIAFAKKLREKPEHIETPLMFLTAKGETEDRLEGFRVGADDYLTKPFDLEELLARVQVQARRVVTARKLRALLRAEASSSEQGSNEVGNDPQGLPPDLYAKVAMWEARFPDLAGIRRDSIVGQSEKVIFLLREILMRAPGTDPVLIIGETGTGKTGVAEALFRLGPRASGPFRVVNCAELAAADAAITLGKLFGYGKGSGLSGVPKEGQPGLLEDVDGGTLFLDEIHRLPLEAQAMLLLPIEGRPFHSAVGKGAPKQVDVKFIFATNVDLLAESQAGNFPFDLYQRLSASQIRVPSLGERREDLPSLAQHFLDDCKDEFAISEAIFAPTLLQHLKERNFPGNIRELRALIREMARQAAFELDSVLTLDHLPESWNESAPPSAPSSASLEVDSKPVLETGPVGETAVVADAPKLSLSEAIPGENDDSDGFWNELEMQELRALRRHRFKIAAAEQELGLSSKSRTLTNHLRGMCFKAMGKELFDLQKSASLIVSRDDDALLDRTSDRMAGYLDMVRQHTAAHTTKTLFNNLPRDYRKHVEAAIERARSLSNEEKNSD